MKDKKIQQLQKFFEDPKNKEEWDQMYFRWIDTNYPDKESAWMKCGEATKMMKNSFPWLKRVRGIVYTMQEGEQPHWWLECPLINRIIDPTAKQFSLISHYEKLDDSDPRCLYPRRKCMNCGNEYYREEFACSDKCLKELEDAFG